MDNNIPNHIADEALRIVKQSDKYKRLASSYAQAMIRRQYIQASFIAKQMRKIEDDTIRRVASVYINEQIRIDTITETMSEHDRIKMNTLAHALMMMADVIEVSISELNGIMKKYFDNMTIVSFDRLKELSAESKRLIAYFDETAKEEYNTSLFGSSCDNLYEMIYNKAKSYCTKVQHHKNMIKR